MSISMSNIFSLLNPPIAPRAPGSSNTSHPAPSAPPPPPPPPVSTVPPVQAPQAPRACSPSPATKAPPLTAAASLLGLLNSTQPATDPVLALYTRRLTSQTEALYSLLQTSLSEIRDKQESLERLLAAAEKSLNVMENKVREAVGKVGEEVDQTLVQLRKILSTTSSILLAIDGKLVEAHSGNGSLLRRMDRIEGRVEGAVECVERVERVLVGIDNRMVKMDIAGGEPGARECAKCTRPLDPSIGSKLRRGRKQQRRGQSPEIPSSLLSNMAEKEKPLPKPQRVKRRRLMSDNEVVALELEELNRTRAVEAPKEACTGIPGDTGKEWKNWADGYPAPTVGEAGRAEKVVEGVQHPVVPQKAKRRILLTTQELEGILFN